MGVGMVLWLVDRGITDVVALDLAPERRERALALGARVAFDPTKEDLRARLMELHGKGRVFSRETVGTDAWHDAASPPRLVSAADPIGTRTEKSRGGTDWGRT